MPRPRDLPQPVKEHGAHDGLWRTAPTPAPGAYEVRTERSRQLGVFTTAGRFTEGQLVPGDLSTQATRSNDQDGKQGPKYDPKFNDTKIPVTFSRSLRRTFRPVEGPGPGAYGTGDEEHWKRGVGFALSRRRGLAKTDDTPSATVYSPRLAPRHYPKVNLNTAGRGQGRPSTVASAAPLTGLDSMDAVMETTRPRKANDVTIPKAARFAPHVKPEDDRPHRTVGPGQYNVVDAAAATHRKAGAGRFGTAPRRGFFDKADTNAPFQTLPKPEQQSHHSSAAKVGFTMARRDFKLEHGDSCSPGPKYKPDLGPSRGRTDMGVARFSHAERRTSLVRRSDLDGPGPTAYADQRNHWERPATAASFGSSTRNGGRPDPAGPGPGVYDPRLPRRPESSGQSFTRAARDVGKPRPENTPGPKYNPDDAPTRVPVGRDISFPKAARSASSPVKRKGGDSEDDALLTALQYKVKYSVVDKSPRSAVIYLGG